jgi:uncharacterized protein (DUF2236 family)
VRALSLRPHPDALFGPASVSYKYGREGLLVLGGPRALLLQVAEPAVAAGVAEHSRFEQDPLSRLVATLHAMTTVSFGPPDEARRVLARLERRHAAVRGRLPDGTPYAAEDPVLKRWVLATILDTALLVERRYLGVLTDEERDQAYLESRRLFLAFGVPEDLVPEDLASFSAFMAERTAKLRPDERARAIARAVLRPKALPVPGPLLGLVEAVTADLLPEQLRRGFGLSLDPATEHALRTLEAASRLVVPRLPVVVRKLPFVLASWRARSVPSRLAA